MRTSSNKIPHISKLLVMHTEISVNYYSVDNGAFFQNTFGHRTEFRRNSLGK